MTPDTAKPQNVRKNAKEFFRNISFIDAEKLFATLRVLAPLRCNV